MAERLSRLIGILLMPFALASCVLTPGKFVSTLRIDADRQFAFSYAGEVIAVDIGDEFIKGMGVGDKAKPAAMRTDERPGIGRIAFQKSDGASDPAARKAAADAKNRAIAEALSKEAGYRRVAYLGDGKFSVDYAIAGTLDRGFVWPYNLDAEIVFPFVVLEVRGNNTVRVKAPAFANQNDTAKGLAGLDGPGKGSSQLDGTFTLDTDAEIVSQNDEDGVVTRGPRKTVTWKATPTTKDAPTAVLRFTR